MSVSTTLSTSTSLDLGPARALSCRECGHEIPLAPEFACPECFAPLEVAYEFTGVTRERIEAGPKSIWRYASLLPVPTDVTRHPNTEPGLTRLVRAERLGKELGIKRLWLKDDTGNPTHSFKDRVVAVALAAARELGFSVLACPSTGNLANAVAAAAARAGRRGGGLGVRQRERPPLLRRGLQDAGVRGGGAAGLAAAGADRGAGGL